MTPTVLYPSFLWLGNVEARKEGSEGCLGPQKALVLEPGVLNQAFPLS